MTAVPIVRVSCANGGTANFKPESRGLRSHAGARFAFAGGTSSSESIDSLHLLKLRLVFIHLLLGISQLSIEKRVRNTPSSSGHFMISLSYTYW